MIITYIKDKQDPRRGLIPKGRIVQCTSESARSEIENGYAIEGGEIIEEDQPENSLQSIREIYEEVVGKFPPKSWSDEKVQEKLDEFIKDSMDKELDRRIEQKIKDLKQ